MGDNILGTTGRARFRSLPGETLTAFALSKLEEELYPGEPSAMVDTVDYKFINGFVDVPEPPCRHAIRAEIAGRDIALEREFEIDALNLPGFNRRLEFSGFWHLPTRLRRWARTILFPQRDGHHRLQVSTCGGVNLWVDGRRIAKFEPFTRNKEQSTSIELPLKAEGSEVVLLVEEMAERDAVYFVELTWQGDGELFSEIPGNACEADINILMSLARTVRPEKTVFRRGEALTLVFDQVSEAQVLVEGRVQPSVHMRDKEPLLEVATSLQAGKNFVVLAKETPQLPDGYHALKLTLSLGETRVEREIGLALIGGFEPRRLEGDLAARKKAALRFASTYGEARIGRVLAMLSVGVSGDEQALKKIIADTLHAIKQRRDCSDFVMVPLLWVYAHYRDKLDEQTCQAVEAAILDYRYWMDEPGDDVMWFWSENHVLCFHTAQYLAGKIFPERQFSASGRSGSQQHDVAKARLSRWFASVEAHGLAEWNSAAYYPIDFIGLLALFEMGEDAVAQPAKRLLDQLFRMIALHTINGVSAGTMGRAYDKELRAGPLTELSPFATVAFGKGWLNEGVAALTMFCAGSYAPPDDVLELVSPPSGEALTAHYVQGYGTAARLALFKSAAVQLSSSIDGRPGQNGHQQHLMDIQFSAHPFAKVWINHPGEDDPWGTNRPSYWAGNGVMPRVGQHENICMMIYDLGDTSRIAFTHAYAPLEWFDEHRIGENYLLLKSGSAFTLLAASQSILAVTDGPGAQIEFRSEGRCTAWFSIVGDLPTGGLDDIKAQWSKARFSFDSDRLQAWLSWQGQPTLMLDYAEGLFVGGRHKPFPNENTFPMVQRLSPFPAQSRADENAVK
jgi:hypothetical protein